MDFHEILCWEFLLKFVDTLQLSLKSELGYECTKSVSFCRHFLTCYCCYWACPLMGKVFPEMRHSALRYAQLAMEMFVLLCWTLIPTNLKRVFQEWTLWLNDIFIFLGILACNLVIMRECLWFFFFQIWTSIWSSWLDNWSLWKRSSLCYWLLWWWFSSAWKLPFCNFGCSSSYGFMGEHLGSYESGLLALGLQQWYKFRYHKQLKVTNAFLSYVGDSFLCPKCVMLIVYTE